MRPQFARDQISDLELEELHIQNLMRHIQPKDDGWTELIDLQPLFFRLTLDSATEFLFGQSVDSQVSALPGGKKNLKTGHDWTTFAPSFDRGTSHCAMRFRFADLFWIYNPKDFRDCVKEVQDFADYFVKLVLSDGLQGQKEKELEKGGRTKEKYVVSRCHCELALPSPPQLCRRETTDALLLSSSKRSPNKRATL